MKNKIIKTIIITVLALAIAIAIFSIIATAYYMKEKNNNRLANGSLTVPTFMNICRSMADETLSQEERGMSYGMCYGVILGVIDQFNELSRIAPKEMSKTPPLCIENLSKDDIKNIDLIGIVRQHYNRNFFSRFKYISQPPSKLIEDAIREKFCE